MLQVMEMTAFNSNSIMEVFLKANLKFLTVARKIGRWERSDFIDEEDEIIQSLNEEFYATGRIHSAEV